MAEEPQNISRYTSLDDIVKLYLIQVGAVNNARYNQYMTLAQLAYQELEFDVLKKFTYRYLPVDSATKTVAIPDDMLQYTMIGFVNQVGEVIELSYDPKLVFRQEVLSPVCHCDECGCTDEVCSTISNVVLSETVVTIPTPLVQCDYSVTLLFGQREGLCSNPIYPFTFISVTINGFTTSITTVVANSTEYGAVIDALSIPMIFTPRTITGTNFGGGAFSCATTISYYTDYPMTIVSYDKDGVTVLDGTIVADATELEAYMLTLGWMLNALAPNPNTYVITNSNSTWSNFIIESQSVSAQQVVVLNSSCSSGVPQLCDYEYDLSVISFTFPYTIYLSINSFPQPITPTSIVNQSDLDTFFASFGFVKISDTKYIIYQAESTYDSAIIRQDLVVCSNTPTTVSTNHQTARYGKFVEPFSWNGISMVLGGVTYTDNITCTNQPIVSTTLQTLTYENVSDWFPFNGISIVLHGTTFTNASLYVNIEQVMQWLNGLNSLVGYFVYDIGTDSILAMENSLVAGYFGDFTMDTAGVPQLLTTILPTSHANTTNWDLTSVVFPLIDSNITIDGVVYNMGAMADINAIATFINTIPQLTGYAWVLAGTFVVISHRSAAINTAAMTFPITTTLNITVDGTTYNAAGFPYVDRYSVVEWMNTLGLGEFGLSGSAMYYQGSGIVTNITADSFSSAWSLSEYLGAYSLVTDLELCVYNTYTTVEQILQWVNGLNTGLGYFVYDAIMQQIYASVNGQAASYFGSMTVNIGGTPLVKAATANTSNTNSITWDTALYSYPLEELNITIDGITYNSNFYAVTINNINDIVSFINILPILGVAGTAATSVFIQHYVGTMTYAAWTFPLNQIQLTVNGVVNTTVAAYASIYDAVEWMNTTVSGGGEFGVDELTTTIYYTGKYNITTIHAFWGIGNATSSFNSSLVSASLNLVTILEECHIETSIEDVIASMANCNDKLTAYTNYCRTCTNASGDIVRECCTYGGQFINECSYEIELTDSRDGGFEFPLTDGVITINGINTSIATMDGINDLITYLEGLGFYVTSLEPLILRKILSADTYGAISSVIQGITETFTSSNCLSMEIVQTCATETICNVPVKECGCAVLTNKEINTLYNANIINNTMYERWIHGGDISTTYLQPYNLYGFYNVDMHKGIIQLDPFFKYDTIYLEYYGSSEVSTKNFAVPLLAREFILSYIHKMANLRKGNVPRGELEYFKKECRAAKHNLRLRWQPPREKQIIDLLKTPPAKG